MRGDSAPAITGSTAKVAEPDGSICRIGPLSSSGGTKVPSEEGPQTLVRNGCMRFHRHVPNTVGLWEDEMPIVLGLVVVAAALLLMGWAVGHFGKSRKSS